VNKIFLVLCLVLSGAAAAFAQAPPREPRREALQAQIVQRFVTDASTRMGLDQERRDKLQQHLRDSGKQRRELVIRSAQLRRRMMESVRDSATSDVELRQLLAETVALRDQESELFKDEQESLSRFLTPRQQVEFVFMWLRFNDQIREMALRPPGRPGMGWRKNP
jgi:Spy/CpxP family protein refolding chaperone